jgi:hypothetical protein
MIWIGSSPEYDQKHDKYVCPNLWCKRTLQDDGSIKFCQHCELAWEWMAGQWVPLEGYIQPEPAQQDNQVNEKR